MKKFLLTITAVLMAVLSMAQTRTLTGTVISGEDNLGIPFANVQVKGTTIGTTTDINGHFSLQSPQNAEILVFSYVGFKTVEVEIAGKPSFNIVLQPSPTDLNAVVVVGYGITKKSDLTGAVAQVSSDQLKASIITNLDQALQGRVAGLQMSANSGAPGAANSIRVRGTSSISGSNEPLYVIDGIPVSGQGSTIQGFGWDGGGTAGQIYVNPLSAIAPGDIISIDVLKDASATAIYGSAGANGVIIVTTKRGDKGNSTITYDGFIGIQQRAKKLNMMNLSEYAQYQNNLYNEGMLPSGLDNYFLDPNILGKGTDWQNEVTRLAIMHGHSLGLSGGTEKTNYAVSIGYTNQDGIMINSDFERYNARVNVDHIFSKWFQAGASLAYSRTTENIVNNDGVWGLIMTSALMSPQVPVYDLNGNYAGPETTSGSSKYNPVALTKDRTNKLSRDRVMGNVYGQLNVGKYFNVRTEFAFDAGNENQTGFLPKYSYGSLINDNIQGMSRRNSSIYWMSKTYATYNQSFGKHNINLMAGAEFSRSDWEGSYIIKEQLSTNDVQVLGKDGVYSENGDGWADAVAKASFFGRANYNYGDRYLFTATVRGDGSSRFGINHRWGVFPSAAAAWRISNEAFMEGTKSWLYNLKLRLGWGMNGNDNIPNFLFGSPMNAFSSNFGTIYIPAHNANSDLKWEASLQYNAGLDLALFDGRVDLTADFYYKTTKDMLLLPSVTPVIGGIIDAAWINAGNVINKGIDISLNTYNVELENFKWNTNIVFSLNRNKVTALNDATATYFGNIGSGGLNAAFNEGGWSTLTLIQVGQPLGVFYGYQTDGLYVDAEDLRNSAKLATDIIDRQNGVWIGDIKYKDISGPNGVPDGVIDEYDKTIIGNPNPIFTFGFNNTFTFFKNFELNIGLTGAVGGKILNYMRTKTEGSELPWDNQSVNVLDRAHLGYYDGDNTAINNGASNLDNSYLLNPDATMPRYSGVRSHNYVMSDYWLEDGSYLRLQNIALAYNLPKACLTKMRAQKFRIYFNVQNVWTFSKYSGLDPEIGSFNQNALYTNIDLGRYPAPRIYTLGVNIAF